MLGSADIEDLWLSGERCYQYGAFVPYTLLLIFPGSFLGRSCCSLLWGVRDPLLILSCRFQGTRPYQLASFNPWIRSMRRSISSYRRNSPESFSALAQVWSMSFQVLALRRGHSSWPAASTRRRSSLGPLL